MINFPLFSHFFRLKNTSATIWAGERLIVGFYDRGVSKQGGRGRPGGHGVAGAAVQHPAVQVGAGGGQQLQASDTLVTGLVILFASLKLEWSLI